MPRGKLRRLAAQPRPRSVRLRRVHASLRPCQRCMPAVHRPTLRHVRPGAVELHAMRGGVERGSKRHVRAVCGRGLRCVRGGQPGPPGSLPVLQGRLYIQPCRLHLLPLHGGPRRAASVICNAAAPALDMPAPRAKLAVTGSTAWWRLLAPLHGARREDGAPHAHPARGSKRNTPTSASRALRGLLSLCSQMGLLRTGNAPSTRRGACVPPATCTCHPLARRPAERSMACSLECASPSLPAHPPDVLCPACLPRVPARHAI